MNFGDSMYDLMAGSAYAILNNKNNKTLNTLTIPPLRQY